MTLVVALALAFAPSATFPGLLVEGGFMTPSGNIACNVGKLGPGTTGPPAIGCALYSKTTKRGGIATWWMKTSGPALFAYVVANPATDYPKVGYGHTYTWRGIRCSSARTGLTCRNRSGHGFFLSRERQRIF